MFIISTRNYPPEVGGMQNLMGGLANALINHGPVKVFADKSENFEKYDKLSEIEIERFGGIKLFRKYRKANRELNILKITKYKIYFFDHWKSIEKINPEIIKKHTNFLFDTFERNKSFEKVSLNKRF